MDLMPSKRPSALKVTLSILSCLIYGVKRHSIVTIWRIPFGFRGRRIPIQTTNQALANTVMPTSSSPSAQPWEVGVLCEGTLLFDARNADGATPWTDAAKRIVVAMRGEEDGWHFWTYLDLGVLICRIVEWGSANLCTYDYYVPQLQVIEASIRSLACLKAIAIIQQYSSVQNLQHFGWICHTWGVWIHGTQSRGVWCCRAGDSRQWGCPLEARSTTDTFVDFLELRIRLNRYHTDWTKRQLRFLRMTSRWPRRMLAEQWPNRNRQCWKTKAFWSATAFHLARSIGDRKPWNTCCFRRPSSHLFETHCNIVGKMEAAWASTVEMVKALKHRCFPLWDAYWLISLFPFCKMYVRTPIAPFQCRRF